MRTGTRLQRLFLRQKPSFTLSRSFKIGWRSFTPSCVPGWARLKESFAAYLHAQAEVELLRNDLASYFSRHDLLLCPVTLVPAHAQNASELVINGNTLPPRSIVRTTVPFSLYTGYPALSLPFGYNPEGLLIGVQLVGRRFDEATVLQTAVILEEARGRPRVPPISRRQKSA